MGQLDGKVAIITGAASGFGLADAKAFVKEGAKVVMTDLNEEEGQKQAKALGDNAIFVKQDVSKEEEWQKVFDKAKEAFGPVNAMVNNAGILVFDNAETVTLDDLHKTLSVNLDGVVLGEKYGIINMKKTGGSIVNMSSIAGIIGVPKVFSYAASKGAVRVITKAAALHCCNNHYPIRINSIHPGYAHTPMIDIYPDMRSSAIEAQHPMGRLARPEEIANLAVFLASDKSSFSTGSEFLVDGGYTAQ